MYLDHNAGGRIRAEVAAAITEWLQEPVANPSSLHAAGRRARDAMEAARDEVAGLLRAAPGEIVFTGSGSEANSLAVLGVARSGDQLFSTPIEHASVLASLEAAARLGATTHWLGVDAHGRVSPDAVAQAVAGGRLVTLGWGNGEIGVLQPVAEVAAALAELPASERPLLHTDAVQVVGVEDLDVGAVPVDLLTLSGHKLGAPPGIGALFVRRDVTLTPLVHGGPQERERRAGTENLLGIIGFGVAAKLAREDREARVHRIRSLRERLWSHLSPACGPVDRYDEEPSLPGTLSVGFRGLRGDALLVALDAVGVAASTGSACAAGAPEPSHVLRALGYDDDAARSVLRFSLGSDLDDDAIDQAGRAICGVVADARRREGQP
jgi:cysteine desulfurase